MLGLGVSVRLAVWHCAPPWPDDTARPARAPRNLSVSLVPEPATGCPCPLALPVITFPRMFDLKPGNVKTFL